jgi:thiol-disulfide isomerase/thioredoxin
MDFLQKWPTGLGYTEFLNKYATPEQRRRWDDFHATVSLTASQKELLATFRRDLLIVVVAGAWCGDCIQQCPIFDHFARETPRLQFRYFDRDDNPDLADELSICGGRRVPSIVYLAEDGAQCGRAGDRTLSKYRDMASSLEGAFCPTGLVAPGQSLLASVTQDWLDDIERIQLMLRTSARLRQKHGD